MLCISEEDSSQFMHLSTAVARHNPAQLGNRHGDVTHLETALYEKDPIEKSTSSSNSQAHEVCSGRCWVWRLMEARQYARVTYYLQHPVTFVASMASLASLAKTWAVSERCVLETLWNAASLPKNIIVLGLV